VTDFVVKSGSHKRPISYRSDDEEANPSPAKHSRQAHAIQPGPRSIPPEQPQSSLAVSRQPAASSSDILKLAVAFLCIKKAKQENMSAFEWWQKQREILFHGRTDAECSAVSALLSREELQNKVGV
jgi:hypothetical protein